MGEMRYPCAPNAHPLVVEAMVLLEQSGRELQEVCNAAGLNPGTVANWRSGKYTPNLFMILLLLEALGYRLAITKNTPGY